MDVDQFRTTQTASQASVPRGDWGAKPAIPASTVAATNTTDFPMLVEVTGGTVTVVKVDNVTVGARIAGSFRVRPGGTIALTYSVAPTWQWFYE